MFTISTIATPDPHHLLALAHHRPCRVFPAGAVSRIPLAEAPAQLDGTCALSALDGSDVFGRRADSNEQYAVGIFGADLRAVTDRLIWAFSGCCVDLR